jgi:two-component system nitrogen regulation sensor histidine kinase GlnL
MEPDFGSVFAALPVAALVVDPAGRIRHANAACEQLLMRSERAMVGQRIEDVVALPGGYPGAEQVVSLFDGEFADGRGHRFRADFGAAPLADHPGWRTVTLHAGMGPRRMAQHGGARAAVGAAAMLAHEVKNPLSGIRGAAQLLGAGEGADTRLTGLITAEVDRIAALIDRMQDFTDTRPLTLGAHNVHPLIDHVRRLAEAGFAAQAVIEERFDPSLPPAMLDPDALVQVLLNLVRNAVEAGAGRVQLTSAYRHGLAVSAAPGRERLPLPIELSVIDDGPGAPSDIADHIFEPFVSGKPEGRGLGLALVDKLVGQMGGVVQHAREGRRTVFRVLLARATR